MAEELGTEATTTEATETTEATASEQSASELTWDDPEPIPDDQDLFPRKYVEELRDREAKYRIKARDYNSQFEEFGGSDAVRAAVELQQQLQTDDGVISMFIEAGRALGLGTKELEALFGEGQVAPEGEQKPALESLNDDDQITVADAKSLVKQAIQDAIRDQVIAPQKEQEFQNAVAGATRAVTDTVAELKIPEADVDAVLAAGQKYLAENDFDPAHVANAVRRGNDDFNKAIAAKVEERLKGKLETAQNTPSSTGGTTAGSTALPEPKNVAEGRARARVRLGLRGEPV